MIKVARWTGIVRPNENGGFVAYGDYLALEEERDALRRERDALRVDLNACFDLLGKETQS